jgi:GntR family transcriptional regulator
MNIELKDSTHSPVYVQIREQIETRIRNKEVSAGDALPSPTALSQKLSVDKGEIQRAYFELERSGLVKRQTSKDFLGKPKVTYLVA